MTNARIINGKVLAESIRVNLSLQTDRLKSLMQGFQPHLAVIQVGARQDSQLYVRMKGIAAGKAGIKFTHESCSDDISQNALLDIVQNLNRDHSIHGILVQLPLPAHIDERLITESIDVRKDVDGFHSANIGLLAKKNATPYFEACTPRGIMALLKSENIILKGKTAVVVGRSNIVGMPVAHLLQNEDATVTVCHSQTPNIPEIVKTADILVVAIGSPEMIKGSWLKPGVVIIDVGTNAVSDVSKKSGIRWVGDVDFDAACKVASAITPVPGGVGPMTVAMLMENTVTSATRFMKGFNAQVQYLEPEIKEPVPRFISLT